MANLPPGFILDSPQGALPEGFALDSQVKDAPNSPTPAPSTEQDNPDDMMKYLARMAKAVYGISAPGAAIQGLASEAGFGLDPESFYQGVKRTPVPQGATFGQSGSNLVGRMAIPTIVGAGVGGMMAGPPGAAGGALRGIAATAATEGVAGLTGEAAGQYAATVLGNKTALSGSELAGQGALSAVMGGGARGIGELAIKGIPAAKGAAKSVSDLAGKYGLNLTPAEITASRALSGLEVFLEKTILGSGGIAARREANIEALRVFKDKLLAKAGTDTERQAIGLAFFDKIKERALGFNNAVKEMYTRAFSSIPAGEAIEANNFISMAERLAESQKRSPFGGSGTSGQKVLDFFDGGMTYHVPETPEIISVPIRKSPTIKGVADVISPETGAITKGYPDIPGYQIPEQGVGPYGIEGPRQAIKSRTVHIEGRIDPATGTKLPVKLSPQDMIEIRTDLSQAIADNDAGLKIGLRTMSSRQAGAYKMMLAAIEKDLDNYAASSSVAKDFVTKYRAAKNLAKMNYDIFNNPSVVNILKRNPESVISIIGRDSVSEIQQLKRAAGEKGFDEIRKLWLTGLINEEKNSTGKSLVNALAKHSDDTLREVFKSDPGTLKELMEIAKLQSIVGSAERTTSLTGSARGVVTTGMSTVGALIGSTAGGTIGAGAGVIGMNLAPYKISQIYLSPTMRKIVLDGLRAAPGSRAKAIAAARIAAFASKAAVTR